VTWAFIVATVTGLILGLLFRVPALIASSILGGLFVVATGLMAELPSLTIVLAAAALVCAHHGGYIAGLLFHYFWLRHREQNGKSQNG
jgi:hypothetical protein